MSEQADKHTPGGFSVLTVLPALTLLAVVNLFAVQAIVAADRQPADASRHAAGQASQTRAQGHLPVLGKLAPFSLTERSGRQIDQGQLQGKVWIADFIFTSCQAECPLMSAEMQKLQQAFSARPELMLVSFSVDPETDTPARLSSYANQYAADPARWWFFTGAREALHKLAIEDFKLPVQDLRSNDHHDGDHGKGHDSHTTGHDGHGEAKGDRHQPEQADAAQSASAGLPAPPAGTVSSPFLHSQKFVLVDQDLQIRGYYDSNNPEAMRSLVEQDLPRLLPGS